MENLSELISLYTNLFVITITIVGILLASIVALTQLLEPFLVSKSAQRLIRPTTLIFSAIFLTLSTIATLLPMTLLSIGSHDFIKGVDFRSNDIFTNQLYVVLSVSLLIVSAALVTVFISRASRYLVPTNALAYLRNGHKKGAVVSYFQKSAAARPVQPFRVKTMFDDSEGGLITISQSKDEDDKSAEKQYQLDLRKYEADKEKLAKMENPLFPLETYLTRSIQRGNITIVVNTLKSFEDIIGDLIKDKENEGLEAIIRYYKTVLENAHELAQSVGLQSISLELLNSSSRVADELLESQKYTHLNTLLEYWKPLAGESLGDNPMLFRKTVGIIGEVSSSVIRQKDGQWDDMGTFVDNVSRSLGWLGERLLEKGAPERRTIMHDDYETEFGVLVNAVLGIGWELHSNRADIYPLIYFDCLYVIAKKLAPYAKADEGKDRDNSNTLFSLMYDVFSFGEAAIVAGNLDGAVLSLLRLDEHLEIAEDNDMRELRQHILDEIFRLGALAAGNEMQGLPYFLHSRGGNLAEAAINTLKKRSLGYNLDGEAREILIKASTNTNHEKIREYLFQAGQELGTDFGMNLSPN